jgi:ParB family chromosome partitioning protein
MLIANEGATSSSEILQVDPKKVEPNPFQPRKRFPINELESLKTSIAKEGLLQPVLVRRVGENYQLVAGERRLRAAQDLGLEKIPAVLLPVGDDRLLEMALIENVHREDLNPIELANAYRQLMQFKGWTQEALAENLGLGRPTVSNTLRLLDLPADIQDSIARAHITMGHAKVLLSVTDPKEQRLLFEKIAEDKLTVRDLEEHRDDVIPTESAGDHPGGKKRKGRPAHQNPETATLEEDLSEKLGTRVRIRERKGKGRIVIDFYSPEDFDRIRGLLLAGARSP